MEYGKRVIALGFFDGVHAGHAALLNKTKETAERLGVTPAVLSFDTPPVKTIDGAPVPLITSTLDRADIIKRLYGIDPRTQPYDEKKLLKVRGQFLTETRILLGLDQFPQSFKFFQCFHCNTHSFPTARSVRKKCLSRNSGMHSFYIYRQ